jgi:hypothetical protein
MLDLAAFRVRFREFDKVLNAKVQAALDDAEKRTDAEVFGDSADQAHGLLAAHLLAANPGGREARLQGPLNSDRSFDTVYSAELDRLKNECCAGGWITP